MTTLESMGMLEELNARLIALSEEERERLIRLFLEILDMKKPGAATPGSQ